MRQKCEYCGALYTRGEMVDVGVGYIQVSEDEPSCNCEYITWMKEGKVNSEDDEEEN